MPFLEYCCSSEYGCVQDGRLILGKLCPDAKVGTKDSGKGGGNFAIFAVNILKSILCLSRVEPIHACTQRQFASDPLKTNVCRSTSEDKQREVAVTIESSIYFLLCDFPPHCSEVCLDAAPTSAESVDSNGTPPVNCVRVQVMHQAPDFELDIGGSDASASIPTEATVSVRFETDYERMLVVRGVRVGEALIKITYTSNNLEADMGNVERTNSIYLRVQVLPHIATASTAVHELIGLLEATHIVWHVRKERKHWNAAVDAARLVFQAHCMRMDFSCEENVSRCDRVSDGRYLYLNYLFCT